MPKGRSQRLPSRLTRNQLVDALKAAGAVFHRRGNHQEVWRIVRPDGSIKTFPISDYRDYDEGYVRGVFLQQIGLTKPQMLAAVNGENPWKASAPTQTPLQAPAQAVPQTGQPPVS